MALTKIKRTGLDTGITDNSDANAITIDSSERVGIKTTSPDGTLHAHTATAGSVTAHANADDLVVENSDHGGISILTPNNKTGQIWWGAPASNVEAQLYYDHNNTEMKLGTIDSGGYLLFNTASNVQALKLDASQNAIFAGDVSFSKAARTTLYTSTSNQGLHLKSNGTAPLELNQDTGGDVQIAEGGGDTLIYGKVGIGTTAPSVKLHITGTDAADTTYLRIENKPASAATHKAIMEFWTNEGNTNNVSYNTGRIFGEFIGGAAYANTALVLGSAAGSGTFNDEITLQNGKVGIGTTAPASILDLSGTNCELRLNRTATNQFARINFVTNEQETNGSWAIAMNDGGATDATPDLSFHKFTGTDAEVMRLTDAGNVGIGVTDPDFKLEIKQSDAEQSGIKITDNAGSDLIKMGARGAAGKGYMQMFNGGTSTNVFDTGGVSYFNGGNVGIGTTSPQTALEVQGHLRIDPDSGACMIDMYTGGTRRFEITASEGDGSLEIRPQGSGSTATKWNSSGDIYVGAHVEVATGKYFYPGGWSRISDGGSLGALEFNQYNGSSWNDTLNITSAGNATFAGDVTATGGGHFGANSSIIGGSNANVQFAIANAERRYEFFVYGTSSDQLVLKDGTADATRMTMNTSGNFTFTGTIDSGAITSTAGIAGTTATFSGAVEMDAGSFVDNTAHRGYKVTNGSDGNGYLWAKYFHVADSSGAHKLCQAYDFQGFLVSVTHDGGNGSALDYVWIDSSNGNPTVNNIVESGTTPSRTYTRGNGWAMTYITLESGKGAHKVSIMKLGGY